MKMAISNIAWDAEQDELVYAKMKSNGYIGLEIAPTRIFPQDPYDHLGKAAQWAAKLRECYDIKIVSMQSIWFGKKERLFGDDWERKELLRYTQKAICFAEAVGCKNMVFGCPENRYLPEGADPNIAVRFFKEIGDCAADHGIVIGLEANPSVYRTNFINDTLSALEIIEQVDSKGVMLNLDIGTIICNEEEVKELKEKVHLISHVHISEPFLKPINKRLIHQELYTALKEENYQKFVSIEMKKGCQLTELEKRMVYINKIFQGCAIGGTNDL